MKDYFEFTSDNFVINLKLKGFWSKSETEEIGPWLVHGFQYEIDSMKSDKFVILVDMADFGTPSSVLAPYIGECMKYASTRVYKVIEIVPKATVRLGLKRLSKENGLDQLRIVVASKEDAEIQIDSLKNEVVQL